ncbi:MAG: TIGR02285 family protein [Pseudomonadota bacterium]
MTPVTPRFLVIFFISFAILIPSLSPAQDSLVWMEAVAPPFFIHDGALKGQGYEDIITNLLQEHLPQYRHAHIKANISRHYQQWKQGEKACSVGMYKTPERLEFTYYSIPSVFTLPPVLIIHKDHFQAFGGNKTVSLTKILKDGKLIIGRSSNRSYGVEFDAALKTYSNDKNTFTYEGPELSLNLFKMLQAGRIDAFPGLPEEAMYLAETMGIRDQIMTLAVEENQINPEESLSYVACSKNEWGKNAIEMINQALRKQRPTEKYRAAYERWLDPSSVEGYRKLYADVFLKITE